MLRQPNEAPLSRREAVIRANVSVDDRWNAKTSISTSPPHRGRARVRVRVCERGQNVSEINELLRWLKGERRCFTGS